MKNCWRECRLGDLLQIKHGYAFKGRYFGTEGSHIVLTPGNFYDEGGFKKKGHKEKWYSGEVPVLSERDDLIVLTDEAHRSQYDTLAMNMRTALPKAKFLAFTGTPLIAGRNAPARCLANTSASTTSSSPLMTVRPSRFSTRTALPNSRSPILI